MGKNIVITGPMASGKTTLARFIELHGYKRIITYTTRPPRDNEINLIDYNFISKGDFMLKIDAGFFAEYTHYDTVFGCWYYGSATKDYYQNKGTVIILDPRGVLSLKIPSYVVWLDLPKELLIKRALERGDAEEEVNRRIEVDENNFNELNKAGLVDMRITEPMRIEVLTKRIIAGVETKQPLYY